MNLFKEKNCNKILMKEINEIKVAVSYNDNFFVCLLNPSTPICLINDNVYDFQEINCKHNENWSPKYKVLYFKESDEFMLISRTHLVSTVINNQNKVIKKCGKKILTEQTNAYSIIYNNDYQVVNYSNFDNYNNSINISLIARNKYLNYVEEAKCLIDPENKDKLIINLNNFTKNNLKLNYIDDNEELIINQDEMTITFTSTYIQKKNENSNSTTINLGECEKVLKYIYNISEESNLYILKIDKKEEGKNYPLIEYDVFYPLDNGEIELLNLSLCKDVNIELSIPIKINYTIDKYNPKSNYYNDICTKTTSESNIDIPLNDRRNEFINKNMSLCEDNCELINYDNNYNKAKCSCQVKTVLSLDNKELDNRNIIKNFIDFKKITNIEIIKCYRTCFKINNMKNNYGFFIIFFIFILYLICINIFYCKSLKILIGEIIKIMSAINSKEYNTTKNRLSYSLFNKIHKKINIQQTKSSINSVSKLKNTKYH